MKPVVSVVIPCFNHGNYLEEALQSIFPVKDTCEIIIVNDGSTDAATLTILRQLAAKGYQVINQINKGLGGARNAGIKAATGKYILPLDCDNKIRPEYISESLAIMENDENVDVVYANAEYFGEKSGAFKSRDFNLQVLMLQNYIDACAVFRKSKWEEAGGYDENMPAMGLEDWDFWLRVAFHGGQFKYLDKILFDYRYLNNSMVRTLSSDRINEVREYMQKKYTHYWDKNYLNMIIYKNIANRKVIVIHIILKTFSPGFYRFLLRNNLIKENPLI